MQSMIYSLALMLRYAGVIAVRWRTGDQRVVAARLFLSLVKYRVDQASRREPQTLPLIAMA